MSKLSRSLHQAFERLSKNSVSRNKKILIRKILCRLEFLFWMVVQAVFNHVFVDYLLASLGNQRLGNVKCVFLKIFYESESPVKK